MALDALEKDRLRRRMAVRMQAFTGANPKVSCVSAHWYEDKHDCELCQQKHAQEIFIVKNHGGKKMNCGHDCLLEMVRFQVVDVDDFGRWQQKLPQLKVEAERRADEAKKKWESERQQLEKKVIVRKKTPSNASSN